MNNEIFNEDEISDPNYSEIVESRNIKTSPILNDHYSSSSHSRSLSRQSVKTINIINSSSGNINKSIKSNYISPLTINKEKKIQDQIIKYRWKRFFRPTIVCVLSLILTAFAFIVLFSNISWMIIMQYFTISNANSHFEMRFKGLTNLIEEKLRLPTLLGIGMSNMHANISHDTSTLATLLLRYTVKSLSILPGSNLNEILEDNIVLINRKGKNISGIATKGSISNELVYLSSETWGFPYISVKRISDPYLLIVNPFYSVEEDLLMDGFGTNISQSDILFNITLSNNTLNYFGSVPNITTRGWRNATVLKTNNISRLYFSFFNSHSNQGQSEVLFTSDRISNYFQSLASQDEIFLLETNTKHILASSYYNTIPCLNNNDEPYHFQNYPIEDLKDIGDKIYESINVEDQVYNSSIISSFNFGLSFVMYKRIRDSSGLDVILIYVFKISNFIRTPFFICISIGVFIIIILLITCIIGCCMNISITRTLKSFRKNMLLVEDMRLDEVKSDLPILIPFREVTALNNTFYEILLPKIHMYKTFLPQTNDNENKLKDIDDKLKFEDFPQSSRYSIYNDLRLDLTPLTVRSSDESPNLFLNEEIQKNLFEIDLKSTLTTVVAIYLNYDKDMIKNYSFNGSKFLDKIIKITKSHSRIYRSNIEEYDDNIILVIFRKLENACDFSINFSKSFQAWIEHQSFSLKFSISISSSKEYIDSNENDKKLDLNFESVSQKAIELTQIHTPCYGFCILCDDIVVSELEDSFEFRPLFPIINCKGYKTTVHQLVKKYILYDEEWMYMLNLREEKEMNKEYCKAYTYFQNKSYLYSLQIFKKLQTYNPNDEIVLYFINQCELELNSTELKEI